MRTILLIFCLSLMGCVTIPIPPIGDHKGSLGNLKVSVSVSYVPNASPERPPTTSELYAWEKFNLTKPKLLKDK